jgi:hypothetical protein
MRSFVEFVDKKTKDTLRQLGLLKRVLEKNGMTVANFLEDDDPHIFIRVNKKNLSFDGVRIYKIGGGLAYRVQKEEKTHPYGKAYSIDVEGMYDDMISDEMDEEKAGKEVMKSLVQEIRKFFDKSSDAEKELRSIEFDKSSNKDPMGNIVARTTGTDYANQVHNKTT